MIVNQSKKERIARVIVGLALLKSGKKIGLAPLVSGATGYCPMKSKLLGINEVKSCDSSKKESCCPLRNCCKKSEDKSADKSEDKTQAKAEATTA